MKLCATLPDGTPVHSHVLTDGRVSCEILTYGAILRTLTVPDRNGKLRDVVLGFDSSEKYIPFRTFFGAIVGRFANRIGGSSFELNGKRYDLPANEGANQLHSGPEGFDCMVWDAVAYDDSSITLKVTSPDGQGGFPGKLDMQVRYTLADGELAIEYEGVSDADTLCNPTNHAYFNLSGQDSGSVEKQIIQLFASHYTPTDAFLIPTGEIAPVEGTPMDLRLPIAIGERIDEDFPALNGPGGYDHNWAIDGEAGKFRIGAEAYSPESGIVMTMYTDRPAVQFYTGNGLGMGIIGKDGAEYVRRCGFCLETQTFPDAPNHANFPTAVLPAGEKFYSKTSYAFEIK